MKFKTVAQAATVEPPKDDKLSSLEYLEFIASAEAFDTACDEFNDSLEDLSMQISGLKQLKDQIHDKSMEEVNDIVNSHEGLEDLWVESNGDVAAFESLIDANITAMESKIDEWLGDGVLRALVGIKHSKISTLKAELPKAKAAVSKLSDKKVEKRASDTGSFWMFGRVKSRFLLNHNVFDQQADAFIALCAAISALPKIDAVDPAKIMKTLAGTPYMKALEAATEKGKTDGKTDWLHTIVKGLSSIMSPLRWIVGPVTGLAGFALAVFVRFFHDPEQPIGKRGWDSKEKILKGCDKTIQMVNAAEACIKHCETLLADKGSDKDKVKFVGRTAQFVTNSIGEMGRGMLYACSKLTSTRLGRMFVKNRVMS